jgi:PPOX class probable F420-dependent enzyme
MTKATDLRAEQYVSLTTFRRTGTPVSTAVWAAPDDEGFLLVWTGAESGKVKRLRHTATVSVAPCDRVGNVTGDAVAGTARLLPSSELGRVRTAMTRKYGLAFSTSAFFATIGRALHVNAGQVGIEITLSGPAK